MKPLEDQDWLRREYEQRGRSLRDIALELDCAPVTVRDALKRVGIASRPSGTTRPIPQLHDAAWLRAQHAAGHTQAEIATELGCAVSSVGRALEREAGIVSRRKWRGPTRSDPRHGERLTRDAEETYAAWRGHYAAGSGEHAGGDDIDSLMRESPADGTLTERFTGR